MPISKKKAERRIPKSSQSLSRTLMGNQDLSKGDSTTRGDKVCVTFWCSPEKRADMKAFAADHDMTVSRLILEAVDARMQRG